MGERARKKETEELKMKSAHRSLTTDTLTHSAQCCAARRAGASTRDAQRRSSAPNKMCTRILRGITQREPSTWIASGSLPNIRFKQQPTLEHWEANKAGSLDQAPAALFGVHWLSMGLKVCTPYPEEHSQTSCHLSPHKCLFY